MNLIKKTHIFQDEESSIKNNSKSSKIKNRFNKTIFLDNNSNSLTITSYTVQDKKNNISLWNSLKNNKKNIPNKPLYKLYKESLNNSIKNKNKIKNLLFFKTLDSKLRKKYNKNKNNINSLKTINLEIFDNTRNLDNNKKNRTFSYNFDKIKKEKNNSYYTTSYSKAKKIDFNKLIRNKKNINNVKNTYSYIYNDKIHMKFSNSLYKYKYIKPSLYLACLKNMNNKKDIFNLSPEEYNGKNKLFSPLNSTNYNQEIKNLGNNFITNDIMSFKNQKLNIINKRINSRKKNEEEEDKNILNKPCFIEKIVSYKILDQVKFHIKSPSERSKCKNFINKFNSFVYINKL